MLVLLRDTISVAAVKSPSWEAQNLLIDLADEAEDARQERRDERHSNTVHECVQ